MGQKIYKNQTQRTSRIHPVRYNLFSVIECSWISLNSQDNHAKYRVISRGKHIAGAGLSAVNKILKVHKAGAVRLDFYNLQGIFAADYV